MKKRETRKLALNKETLQALGQEQQQIIQGGTAPTLIHSCQNACPTPSPTPR